MNSTHPIGTVQILSILATTATCFVGSVHAEGISLYGVADIYAQYAKGDRNEASIESGGLSGSRLGFNASKDLGNGLSAVAKLEAGYNYDTGQSGQGGILFGRQAYAGLSGDFGTLTLGRQYTPQYNAIDSNDPFGTGAGSGQSSGIISVYATRANNSVNWASRDFGGFTTTVLLSAGEAAGGHQTDGSMAQVDFHFGSGGSGVDLALGGRKKPVDTGVNSGSLLVSGTYDLGFVKILGGTQFITNSTGAPTTDDNRREFWAGVNVPIGNDTIAIGAYSGKTENVPGSRANQYSLEYVHSIAKGFDVYGVFSSISNGSNTAYTDDSATGSGPIVSPGKTATSAAVGFRFKF